MAPARLTARLLDTAAILPKRLLSRHSAAGDALRRWRHRLAGTSRPARPIERVVDAFGRVAPTATFVQIGSNDGVRFDPINRQVRTRRWTGLLVEPVPYLFERLRLHHGGSRRVTPVNVAVAAEDGTRTLYHLAEVAELGSLPPWYDAIGSFDRDVLLGHRDAIPDIEDRVRAIEVPCRTFAGLCETHGLTTVDLIHIDTEGHDWEVLQLVDLARWRPQVVLYEHLHLSPADRAAAAGKLEAAGFRLLADDMDTLAVATSLLTSGPVADAWRVAGGQRGRSA